MDWYSMRAKRSSVSAGMPSTGVYGSVYSNSRPLGVLQQRLNNGGTNYSLVSGVSPPGGIPAPGVAGSNTAGSDIDTSSSGLSDKSSYFLSLMPLNCVDWVYHPGTETDCIALSSYKEDSTNKLQVIHGISYGREATGIDDEDMIRTAGDSPGGYNSMDDGSIEGFDLLKVAEIGTDYPITNLQWDPSMARGMNNAERLAASLEVFRLYQVDRDEQDNMNNTDNNITNNNNNNNNNFAESSTYKLRQTHILANNTNSSSANSSSSSGSNGSGSTSSSDSNTFPPVTSFDWNKTDPSIIITLSVDTTCTIWDLNRSHQLNSKMDTASVKTQLIAHDSEVFDVKFIHDSVNIFASVGNDGSIRVFDLRSLEHSTIIYEPPQVPSATTTTKSNYTPHHNSHALLQLSTSNVDQHHLATIGVNSNQVIIIDMRMPGVPIAKIDGSFDGMNNAAINSIRWHPNLNYLLTGGDDCQALVWDCNSLPGTPTTTAQTSTGGASNSAGRSESVLLDVPILAYEEDYEVNNVTWRAELGDWLGVVAGKGFQAVLL